MDRWIEFKEGNYPKKGKLIMVKNKKGIFPKLLVAQGENILWYYDPGDKNKCEENQFLTEGVTHYFSIPFESPY